MENASDDFTPQKKLENFPPKLRRKLATNFAENFANFTLEIAGAKTQPEPAFGWALIGWVLGRSLIHRGKNGPKVGEI